MRCPQVRRGAGPVHDVVEVGDQVVDMPESDTEPDQAEGDTGVEELIRVSCEWAIDAGWITRDRTLPMWGSG